MRTIHKARLTLDEMQIIEICGLPDTKSLKEQFIAVNGQGDKGSIWFMVDTNMPKRKATVYQVQTGGKIPDNVTMDDFLGTILLMNDCIVLHIFLRVEEDQMEGQLQL